MSAGSESEPLLKQTEEAEEEEGKGEREGGEEEKNGEATDVFLEEGAPATVGFFRLFRFADKLDVFFMVGGSVMGLLSGSGTPLFGLLFGNVVNIFIEWELGVIGDDDMLSQTEVYVWYFVYTSTASNPFPFPCPRHRRDC